MNDIVRPEIPATARPHPCPAPCSEFRAIERRNAELERKLSLQPQTGLPTHFRLDLDLDDAIGDAKRREDRSGFAILIIQLGEAYDAVRATMKSGVSEWVLYQTGCRIASCLAGADRVYHTRETEFVLVLPGRKGEALGGLVRDLVARISEPHVFAGFNVAVRIAMGAAYWPEHGEERSAVLHHADIAAGAAREERRIFVLFRREQLDRVVEKMELQNSIVRALEEPAMASLSEQFVLHFQPKLTLSSIDESGLGVESVEAEALIRWRHPDRGMIGPDEFIPLSEETGLILPIGTWLAYRCARTMGAWDEAGSGGIRVAINLSARQFRTKGAVETLSSALSSAGVDPGRVTIELTETALFEDPPETARILARFKALGLRISVDDFGTGYSSLSHLHRFPLDEIKIDRLFIENLDTNRQDRVIVESLVSIAQGMGLKLVAEGIERPEALRLLWDMGCRGFQGFLFSKPLPPEEFIAYRDRIALSGSRIAAL
jgi:EAL domain-containing protein (putative c-di-GMP-specific phosphodiesterase class I)/GGDEF domain-containing protein